MTLFPPTSALPVTKISSPEQIEEMVCNVPHGSVIFIDIDDTIITPVSKTFHVHPYRTLIDDIKKNQRRFTNFAEIISNWRLQRQIKLTNPFWPDILDTLKQNYFVYGLTKVETGRFGNIGSMEEWRYEELYANGIEFSQNTYIENFDRTDNNKIPNSPRFYKGIFFTGFAKKSQTAMLYRHFLPLTSITFIDDRLEYLLDIEELCIKENIPYHPMQYTGIEMYRDLEDERIFFLQRDYLLQHAHWMEDDEAQILLKRLEAQSA